MQAAAPREGGRPGLLRAPRADRGHVGRADPGREGGTAPDRRAARASLLVGPAGLVAVMPLAGRLADQFGSARLSRPAAAAVAVLPLFLGRRAPACGAGGGAGLRLRRGPAERGPERAGRRGGAGLRAAADGLVPRGLQPGRAGRGALRRAAGLASGRDGRPPADGRPRGIAAAGVAVVVIAGRWLPAEPGRRGRQPLAACRPGRWARARAARLGFARGRTIRPRRLLSRDRLARIGRPARGGAGSARLTGLGLLALCCLIAESAVANWSGVYLRGQPGGPARVCGRRICGFLPGHGGRAAGR